MPFSTDFVFTRGTGKTRTNAAGLIVGVDFSSTSNTITTGSKTFTLAADANVNRDWPVGSNVIVVSQAGVTGSMTGTVTSYTPSTQALVINVTSVTGSGTSTNWRIGSLEMTRDALTGGVSSEPAATNLATFSEDFTNAVWGVTGATVSPNVALAPSGSVHADKLVEAAGTVDPRLPVSFTAIVGASYVLSVYAKEDATSAKRYLNLTFNSGFPAPIGAVFDLGAGTVTNAGAISADIKSAGNGFYLCSVITTAANVTSASYRIRHTNTNSTVNILSPVSYTGDGTSGIFIWGAQLELNAPTSYIPTTTAQVTRAADSFALSSTAINSIRQGQGTLYVEAESADVGPTQKRAIRLSGLTGDIRLAKRGVGNFAGFTKMLEVDNDLYFGVSAGNSQRDNGKEIGSITVAVNERTGQPDTVNNTNSWAWDGANDIIYAGGGTEERLMKKNLSLWSGKGFGSIGLQNCHWTGSRFIVATELPGVSFNSLDGITWRRVNTPVLSQSSSDLASASVSGVLRVVLVGVNGFIATSDDQGETWTARTSGTTNNLLGTVFAFGLFATGQGSGSTQAVRTSPDGITWTARTVSGSIGVDDQAFNGTNLVVSVGAGGYIGTTPDLVTWTQRTSGTTARLRGVHFANGTWVTVGDAGTILTSPDAITWTSQTSGTTNQLNEVNFFNNLFIVSGQGGVVLTSPNGVTWTSRAGNTNVSNLFGIAFSPTRLVITGSSGAVTTSEDGITYTNRTNNNQPINGMAYGNGVFVSVGVTQGGSGYIATIDGAGNYTRRVSGTTRTLLNCRFLGGAFYTSQSDSGGNIFRSVDGVTWATVATFATGKTDVAYNGTNLFVSVGSNGTYATSSDGITWGASPAQGQIAGEGATSLNQVFFANNIFVAVGSNGKIFTSPNGTTWTLRTSGTTQNLNSVMYSTRDQLWYAAGAAGTLLFSADAITWQPVQNAGFASIDNNGLQKNPMLPLWVNGRNRMALSYRQNLVITSQNGVTRTDTTATIPTITAGAMGENLNGLIHKMKFFPTTLTEAEINAMTGI